MQQQKPKNSLGVMWQLEPRFMFDGAAHLSELMDYYENTRILSSAAYNAGRRNVNGWLKRSDEALPFDVWIETIPFRETRGYVQNVLMFASIYDYRMGDTIRFVHANEKVIKP